MVVWWGGVGADRCDPDKSTLVRLDYWLGVTLNDLMRAAMHTGEEDPVFSDFLDACLRFFGVMQCTLSSVDEFLHGYLVRWNGVDYRRQVGPA
jgi:hypothetical protein